MSDVAAHVHAAHGVDAVPIDAVRASVAEAGFAVVRGVATADEARSALASAQNAVRADDDHASVGESPEEVRRNFQKWSLGTLGGGHRTYAYARLLRVIFTPFLDEDRYGAHDLLRRVAVVRNRLLDLPRDF